MTVLGHFIPDVSLSEEAFVARHRVLRFLLWLHVPVMLLLGYANDEFSPGTTRRCCSPCSAGSWRAGWLAGTRRASRGRAVSTSVGFMLSADALVHAGGGMIDLHFHFFVVIALIGLYQDWVPFALAVLLVAVHHFGIGLLAPELVFGGHPGTTGGAPGPGAAARRLRARHGGRAGHVLALRGGRHAGRTSAGRPSWPRRAPPSCGPPPRRPKRRGGGRRAEADGPARPGRADGRTAGGRPAAHQRDGRPAAHRRRRGAERLRGGAVGRHPYRVARQRPGLHDPDRRRHRAASRWRSCARRSPTSPPSPG